MNLSLPGPLILALTWASAAIPCGAATTGTLEPGQAEARITPATTVTLPAQWSHPKVEARGVWLTGGELLGTTETLSAKLDTLQAANFNEVMVDTWFRGYVPYPGSRLVPQLPAAEGRDVIAWILPEIRKRGMLATAWPEYGFYAYFTKNPKQDRSMGALLDKHPHLAAVSATGEKALHNPTLGDFYSLCPANPESHKLLADLIVEQLTKYSFDALNLDRFRFPSEEYCHCAYCREHFQKDTGLELKAFAPGSAEAKTFLEWKREQNALSVKRVTEAVRQARPGIVITAYVVGPDEKDSKAQSWDLWVKRGLVDAVAVSMYGGEISGAARKALELLGGSSTHLLAALNAEQPNLIFLSNVEKARSYAPLGQYTWYAGQVLDDAEGLKSGPYEKPAATPFRK